ncbi:hypothetical protein AWM75_00900 [Aerococcus urinaehominis]|uniref:Uncharacterized protein n=1 Tax=Aerococcus urinaehominis TaxID=128944 RepID=A0A0X8FJU1_9LACT|nr:GntR family transcriptional regulator [Aerococcus urinaehominis]AMB98638.1 hypothetical protein AWM75_00900 [Aerococcus urinaehominis]SDL96430.1 DNA-binding transcriptional regulator, GntR family [Aerococcus urinaehominis]
MSSDSYSKQVYTAVVDGIQAGLYRPDDYVKTVHMTRKFMISRTPVLSAFKKLEADGYVEVVPYKGAKILHQDYDSNNIIEVVQLIQLIVNDVSHKYILINPDFSKDGLDKILADIHEKADRKDIEAYKDQLAYFFSVLLKYYPNRFAAKQILNYYEMIQNSYYESVSSRIFQIGHTSDKMLAFYDQIVNLVLQQDYEACDQLFNNWFYNLSANIVRNT